MEIITEYGDYYRSMEIIKVSLVSPLKMYCKLFYPTKLEFVQSYVEVGRKIACDQPSSALLDILSTRC